jgi:hypothetical protein
MKEQIKKDAEVRSKAKRVVKEKTRKNLTFWSASPKKN